jgi:hypothetical protein
MMHRAIRIDDGKQAFFWLQQGKPDPAVIHWGFIAESNQKVDEFYKAAISAGAKDNISPRARVEYYPGYYAADVFDPDGYSFEVVHKLVKEPHIAIGTNLCICAAEVLHGNPTLGSGSV